MIFIWRCGARRGAWISEKSALFFTLFYLFSYSFKGREHCAKQFKLHRYRHNIITHYMSSKGRYQGTNNSVRFPFVAGNSIWQKVCDLYSPLPASLTIFRTSRLRWNDAKEMTTNSQASGYPSLPRYDIHPAPIVRSSYHVRIDGLDCRP